MAPERILVLPQREYKRESSKNIQPQMNWHHSESRRWKALWTTFISVFRPESSHMCRLHANRSAVFVCIEIVSTLTALCFMFWRSRFTAVMQNFPGVSNELINMLMTLRWSLIETCTLSCLSLSLSHLQVSTCCVFFFYLALTSVSLCHRLCLSWTDFPSLSFALFQSASVPRSVPLLGHPAVQWCWFFCFFVCLLF